MSADTALLDTAANAAAYDRIVRCVAGGGSSNLRNAGVPRPIVVRAAHGCTIEDVEGARLIDLNMGFGPHLFGYGDPELQAGVARQLSVATMTGLPNALDWEAAERIANLVPSIEQVRFANSGTEAVTSSLRLARFVTGRQLVVTFERHYHGWSETVLRASPDNTTPSRSEWRPTPGAKGMIPSALDCTLELPWNDPDALRAAFDAHGADIAAIILEPVLKDGVVPPAPGFLELVRALTEQAGALLVFDEVITGFRLRPGGAQDLYGVRPDITVLSKVMGAGFPVAAFGGSREIMAPLARNEAFHAGVYAGNHLAMAAIVASLDKILANPTVYDEMEVVGARTEAMLRDALPSRFFVSRVGSLLALGTRTNSDLTEERRDGAPDFDVDAHRALQMSCQAAGVYFHPNPGEPWFLSAAHTPDVVEQAIEVIARAADEPFPRSDEQ